ncbi:hypothetical protein STAQ_06370 [Allostella sp. ATCC 35155]|nr:hypothetical protein STAQ_06370 [Stella sp. ATCC 35155]
MRHLFIALCLSLAAGACTSLDNGLDATLHAPDCRSATPGNSIAGFRCTGDYRAS